MLQDEWKLFSTLTLNYGVRYDQYKAFNAENQLSPRVNLVWKPDDATAIHMGYSRYFSPPPYENVASTDIALFDNTTVAADRTDNTPKAERADYYDTGLTRKITDQITLGLDSYFKADSNLLDEGQFGAPIILTPFNYQSGRQYGGEFTANYNTSDFNAYVNASYERAAGKNITSSEFEFAPGDLAYIANNYIPLDHQQILSASGGASYKWQSTIFSADFLYGSGLRSDGATPNGAHVPGYGSVNLGVSHIFDMAGGLTARLDAIKSRTPNMKFATAPASASVRRNSAPGADFSSACPRRCDGGGQSAIGGTAALGRPPHPPPPPVPGTDPGGAGARPGCQLPAGAEIREGHQPRAGERLTQICRHLEVTPDYFAPGTAVAQAEALEHFVQSAEGLALYRAMAGLDDARTRAALITAVTAFSDGQIRPPKTPMRRRSPRGCAT